MIQKLILQNFKSFKDVNEFPLSKINLLTGVNGSGKSTFLQSLLIFNQTFNSFSGYTDKINLNGDCVQLGTFNDVRNIGISEDQEIVISIQKDNITKSIKLKQDNNNEMLLNVSSGNLSDFAFLQKLHYIAADRIGPQEFYLMKTLNPYLSVGTRGEYIGNILYQKRDEIINEDLYIGDKTQELLIQSGEWLGKILETDAVKIDIKNVGNGVIILSFQFGNNLKNFKPSNVGFGYSYILPIIVSGLIAKPNEIILIENPEAHLHPKAQANLIEFLCKVSKCGIQVIIESHSEHILNALRVNITQSVDNINSNDVSILFISNNQEKIKPISINPDGTLESWPSNFFDQTKKDLQRILKL